MKELNQLNHAGEVSDLLSDDELLRQIAGGSHDALQDLYPRYAPLIFNLAAQSLDRPAAEEIVQDVFIALWRNAGTFDPDKGAARGWILRIAHLRVLNEFRRRSRRPKAVPDPEGLTLNAVPDRGPTPEEVVWRDYRRSTVREAVNLLPPAQRQALSLAYFEDLTHEQIADHLSVPLGTVKTRIRTAVQRLRVALVATLVLAAVLVSAVIAAYQFRLHRQDGRLDSEERALSMVTSSDVTPLRLTPVTQGLPEGMHATFRAHPSDNVAVMTFSNFVPAPEGQVYQAWILQRGTWLPLATVTPDSHGHALALIENDDVRLAPEGLEITLEPEGGSQSPTGPVVVAWSP